MFANVTEISKGALTDARLINDNIMKGHHLDTLS